MADTETWRPLVTALGWALVHFIWQGTVVAGLLAGVLKVLQGRSTHARYVAACAALLLISLAPPVTMVIVMSSAPGGMAYTLSPESVAPPESQATVAPAQTAEAKASPVLWSPVWSARLSSLLPWIILLWLLGVIFFALRLFCDWLYTERLQFQGTRAVEEKWDQTLLRLCDQLRARRPVRLLESALVKVPMVIGWLHPVILLPASALTGLTPQQLEAIIAHELAHIRRHDYLINLLQALIEALLFYHPAVWWVSRQIRQEREHCCDDLAVTVCGDARAYARALLEMEQLRAAGPHLAMAANGGSLLPRIQRLVGAEPKRANRFGGLSAGVIALTTVVSAAAGAQILLQAADSADRQVVLAPEDRAAEALLPALQSTSWEVRKAAVERLAQLGGTRGAVEALLGALNDRDWQVREQAAIALGRVHDERAVEPLLKALVDSEWAVREQAARSLGTAGQERAVEPLIHALGDEHQQVREAAAKSLGIIGDRRAMEPLFQALQDADEQVRTKAVEALGLLGEYHPPTVQRGGGVHRVRGPRRSAAMTSRHP